MSSAADPLRGRLQRAVFSLALLAGLAAMPTTSPASLAEARTLAADGQLAEALSAVDAVLAERPDDVAALLLRGVLLSRAGRSDDAIAVFDTIANARPDLPEPHNNLAVLYAAQGRYEEARGALVEAIRLQPDYALAHENLGDVYAKLAALSYSRANQLDPANAGAATKARAADDLIDEAANDTPATFAASPPPAAAPAPARAAAGRASVCILIDDITPAARVSAVARWLRGRDMSDLEITEDTASGGASGYRVFLPPLDSRDAARARVAELRSAGITDLIVITSGAHRNGISLGVFASRDGAQRRVRDLQARGIDARIASREGAAADRATLSARGAFPATAYAGAFPEYPARIVDCP